MYIFLGSIRRGFGLQDSFRWAVAVIGAFLQVYIPYRSLIKALNRKP